MRTLGHLVLATRPKQWTKNLIVYFAFLFTINQRWGPERWGESLGLLGLATASFALFCLLSGAVYLINDVVDVERDRRHPRKRHRPIAAGRVPLAAAAFAAAALTSASLALGFLLSPWFGAVALVYFLFTLAYSLRLKNEVLLDVLFLSAGYVLRAVAGAVVISVPISPWLYVVTSLGALLIGFGKRRNELVLGSAEGVAQEAPDRDATPGEPNASFQQREALREYSVRLLDQLIAVVAPSTLMAYILYTFTAPNLPSNHAMMLTIPLVLYGLFRYLYLIYHRNLGENPEDILFTDRPLVATVLLWLVAAASVLLAFR